jgi:hypothetical protein
MILGNPFRSDLQLILHPEYVLRLSLGVWLRFTKELDKIRCGNNAAESS